MEGRTIHIVRPGICARADCNEKGVWIPELWFWVHLGHKNSREGEPSKTVFHELHLCEEHKQKLTLPDIMDDKGWNFIQRSFMKIKKAIPQRDLTELHFIAIGGGQN